MMLTVHVAREGGLLSFTDARATFSASDAAGARTALASADEARRQGAWIAGYLAYDLGAAFVHEPVRTTHTPLLVLGAFDEPFEDRLPDLAAPPCSPLRPSLEAATYGQALAAIRTAIANGDVYQVNYTVPFHFAIDGDPYALWCALARRTGAPYQAYVHDGERHLLSWSPELFLAFDGRRVETRPMKGTAPPDDPTRLDNAKNRAEHVMIVDLLRNDLRRICDDVRVERLGHHERYPTLYTMTSTIAGTLRDDTSLDAIFAATFPCGSITGAPKRAAVAAISALEPQPRDVYCGSIGYLSPRRRGWWNVAIRTAVVDARGRGRFDAGGGIVCDSDTADEAREVRLKTRFLRDATAPLELWETFASDAAEAVRDAHFARLHASARAFEIDYDVAAVRTACAPTDGDELQLLRLRLYGDGSFQVRRAPLERSREPVRICIAPGRVTSDDPWLAIKSAWRPAHDRAAAHAQARGCFDALLENERGELTEGTRTTLVADLDGTLVTPPLRCGLLPGILRARIVTDATAIERVLTRADLERARAIYVGNSARGLMRAHLIG